MRGETVMTQKDVQDDRRKPDTIGISIHYSDSHHVQRLALSPTEFINEGRIWRMGYAYQIPYRSLVPKASECTNLLVPVAASFSHVACCSLRLESVWMITAHASGVAAAQAAKSAMDVQRLDVDQLQRRLREQRQVLDFIPGQPEKCDRLNGPPPSFETAVPAASQTRQPAAMLPSPLADRSSPSRISPLSPWGRGAGGEG